MLWLLTAALTACGGGSTPAPGGNTAPQIVVKTAGGTVIGADTYVASGGQFIVTASDLEGSIKKVVYSIDGGTDTDLTPASRMILTLPALTGGTHTAKVVATDDAGLTTTLNVPFLVDNAAPVLNSVTLNGTAAATATTFTVGDAATLVARASDTRGDAANTPASVTVNILEGNTVRASGSNVATADLSKNADGTARTAGTVTVTIQAVDSVGFATSRTVNLTFLAAATGGADGTTTTPPTLTWLTPAAEFVSGNGSVNLRASAVRNGQDVTGSLTYSATCGTVVGNIWTLGADCADGSKQVLTATVLDGGKQYSLSKTVTVDSANPSVQLTSPQQGQSVTTNPVTVKVNATDSGSGVEKIDVIATDASGTVTRVGSLQAASGDVIWAPMNGTYTLTATATDKVGRTSSSTVTGIQVQLSSTDAINPTVTAVTLPSGILRGTQTVTVDATDAAPTSGIAKVELLDGSTSLGAQSTGVNGRYTFSLDTSKLSDGTHTLRAVVTDNVGRSGEKTAAVTVDNTAPVVTWQSPAAGSVTKGRVTLNASSNEGTVSYLVDGTATSDVDAATAGVQVDLADGTRQLTAVASDAAGNKSSVAISVTADGTVPTTSITSPATGSTVTQNPVTIQVTGADTGSGIERIEVRANNILVGTVQGNTGSVTWVPTNGTYTLISTAIDKAGNSTVSTANIVTVSLTASDTSAPIAGTAPTVPAGPLHGTVVLGSDFTDPESGVASIELYDGPTLLPLTALLTRTAGGKTSYEFSLNTNTLADGVRNLRVRATNGVGLTTDQLVNITVDNTAPVVTWQSPAAGSVTKGRVTLNASSNEGTVSYLVDGTATSDVDAATAGVQVDLADGTRQLTAVASDAAGNKSSVAVSVTADSTAPTAQITSPTINQTFTSGPISVAVQAQDIGSGVSNIAVYAKPATGNEELVGILTASGSLSWYPQKTDSTAYELRAEVTDKAGNTSLSTLVSGVKLQTASSIIPQAVTVTVPAAAPQGKTVNQSGRDYVRGYLNVNASATTNAVSGLKSAELLIDNTVVATETQSTGNPTFNFNFDTLNDGLHDVAVRFTDNVGTVNAPKISVFVDKTAPVVAWTAPVNGSVTSNASPTLTATATDAVFGALTPTYTVDGGPVPASFSEGAHQLVATSTDLLGNTAQSSISLTVDQTPPDMNVTSPTAGQEFTAAPITISGTATDKFSSVVSISATVTNPDNSKTVLGQQAGGTYSAPFTPSTPGTYSVEFTATDAVGKTQTASRTFTLRDAEAPTITLSSPIEGQLIEGDSFTLSATAADNVKVDSVKFYAGGEELPATSTSGSFTATWNTSTVRNGANKVYAVAIDAAGNRTTSTAVNVTVARKPTVSITSPTTSTALLSNFINVNVSAIDNNGISQVELFADNVRVGMLTSAPYSFSLNTANYANGEIVLFARGTNTTGQVKDSEKVKIQVKNDVAPTLAISAPANGALVLAPNIPVQLTVTRRSSDFDIQPMTYPDPSDSTKTITEDAIRVDMLDYRGSLVASRYIAAKDNVDGVYTTPAFDLAGLPADVYTLRASMMVKLNGNLNPQPVEQTIQFTTRNQSSNPPAAIIRLPVRLNADQTQLPVLNRDSAIFVQASDDTGLKYIQIRFINEDGTPTNAYLLNETLNGQPGPFDRLIPTLEIDGSQYVRDQNYVLRITTEDVDGNRNIQEVKVKVDRGQRLPTYSTTTDGADAGGVSGGAFNDPTNLISGQLNHNSASWGLGCSTTTFTAAPTVGQQQLVPLTCASLSSSSRVIGLVYRNGILIASDVRPQTTGEQKLSYGFTEPGVYQVDWIVQDLSSGVVQRYRGEAKSVTRNE
ncbi:Ig-like domain-containing protein [Deinococcus aquatilis]|uniref:Ig-like domain-containing protein n=1 Tax=Deinococcus aquatilis TaxID=519440 RepID=UPI00035E01CF|nr:Ig-like domain-containing protein [Deinococcus aquatilis]